MCFKNSWAKVDRNSVFAVKTNRQIAQNQILLLNLPCFAPLEHRGLLVLQNYVAEVQNNTGHVAERLGSGLQHHLQRFESARDLKETSAHCAEVFCFKA